MYSFAVLLLAHLFSCGLARHVQVCALAGIHSRYIVYFDSNRIVFIVISESIKVRNSKVTTIINLGFLSNSGNNGRADYNLTSSGFSMSDSFNNDGGGANEASNLFSNNFMSDLITSNIPSLFSSSVQNNNMVPQMSATAWLQKAAQMGSSSRPSSGSNYNDNSLLRSFGTSSTGTKTSNFGNSPSAVNTFANTYANRTSMEHEKPPPPQQQSLNVIGGGSDSLTRDFLGVGQIVLSLAGGAKQQQGIGLSSLSADRNTNITAPTSHHSFNSSEDVEISSDERNPEMQKREKIRVTAATDLGCD